MNFHERNLSLFLATFFLFALLTGCKKDNKGKIKIEGFHMFDAMGNPMGVKGPADDDWTVKPGADMSADIQALFDFSPGVDFSEAKELNMSRVYVYPNPCNNTQNYSVQSTGTVLLKVVVVDKNLRVLDKKAALVKVNGVVMVFDYSDRSKYPNNKSFRVYYSFSAPGKPNYQYGYGDSWICEGGSIDCFK